MVTAAVPPQLADHWTCAVCGFTFERPVRTRARELCSECARGPLGQAAGELARRLVGASQWQEREARMADLTLRHQAVVAVLSAVIRRPDLATERMHQLLLRELSARVEWRGPAAERALFREALGLDPPTSPVPRPRPSPDPRPAGRRWP